MAVTRRISWVLPASVLLMGCPDRSSPGGGAADAAVEIAPDAAAAPTQPETLQFTLVLPSGDAGMRQILLSADEKPEIDPTQTLRLRTNLAISNYRIRVFDEVDRAMVSDDVSSDSAGGLDYRIQFEKPLKSGHRYTLAIDGQAGPLFSDSTGKTHPEQRFELRVSGQRERSKPEPKKRRRR